MKRLRYQIAKWQQATKCLSNNNKNLKIHVTEFVQNPDLSGVLVEVRHSSFGTLFAAMTEGSGRIVSEKDDECNDLMWLSTSSILEQLDKFGFDIRFNRLENLSGDQISYLMILQDLGFDKLTQVNVVSPDGSHCDMTVVAFNSNKNKEWLSFGKRVSYSLFAKETASTNAVNLTAVTLARNFNWDWLMYTCNIADVLDENDDTLYNHRSYKNADETSEEISDAMNSYYDLPSYKDGLFESPVPESEMTVYTEED